MTYFDDSNDQPVHAITIAVVDDHPVLADGMARTIAEQPDLIVAGVAHSVVSAIELVSATTPDVVLMDYHLPDGDGITAAEEILRRWPSTKVLMISGIREEGLLSRAIAAGCVGLMGKDGKTSDLIGAIRSVFNGGSIVRIDDLVGLRGSFIPGELATGQSLTAREYDILRHLAKRTSTSQIAEELSLSIHTVRNHVRNVLTKLGAHSKLEAVAIAARDKILPIDAIG